LSNKAVICFVRSKESVPCPICGELLTVRGKRERMMFDSSGAKLKLVIRRMRCEKCKRIHHELPDCIVPYKRHCTETIETIQKDKSEEAPCELGTIRRIKLWWNIMLPYYIGVLRSLTAKYGVYFGNPPSFREIIRAVVNTNNWISCKKLCTRTELVS
jgi:hypothetical protein